ncbi:fimbrial protein [Pseudomonas turukhanskensis]|uniref:Ferrous iron transporter B n=1 Tax=Pseudomonas turukhanskensis TaxID=1806536 RepID=A0A9W6K058_9PSED|nr:fimbrial protein [Pseudomonas turukhanskensis]GLK87075.1 ferrous iron transporter B [Pseudomonas turukhanskensis]
MKHKLLAISSIMAMAATAQTAMADSGTIEFEGAITATTCDVTVNGQTNDALVTLPTISQSLLKTEGAVAGRTPIKFELTDCILAVANPDPTATTDPALQGFAKVYFNAATGTDFINPAGRLDIDDTIADAATNVNLQILGTDNVAMDLSQDVDLQGTAASTKIENGAATMMYGVQYYATGATGAGIGKVSSSVGYEIHYE